jgi:glycolate oxidase FAD binding subunit
MQDTAKAGGGHAALFSGGDRSGEVRSPLNTVEQRLQQRLKHSFDPGGILNPGRLYSWL